jgi:hypothetical protein
LRVYTSSPPWQLYDVSAPAPWGVSDIVVSEGTEDCFDYTRSAAGWQGGAASASGSISFAPGSDGVHPDQVDVSLTATFDFAAPPESLPPAMVQETSALPVELVSL